ncbi:MAG: hypothetical protein HY017_21985 [Betaproteobacteria bacterium]|nr:hypothetical protein [Betaproteobacteria bacterium]
MNRTSCKPPDRLRPAAVLALGIVLVWAAPMLGLVAAGQPVSAYLSFPPRTAHVSHAAFSWGAFVLLCLPPLAAIGLFIAALANARPGGGSGAAVRRFPWWGWLALGMIGAAWALAWTEALVPPDWRRHVFTPLWLGYALAMNALAWRRSGEALLTQQTGFFLALFPVSAGFWWLFEHLNQFVGNWYYSGISANGDWDYFLQATLPFSTVLPAVASTQAWLRTIPRIEALTLPPVRGCAALAWLALGAGTLALAGIGLYPETLFAMLWLAPLLALAGLQQLLLGETLFAPLARGDWRPLLQPAFAGLICGFLWELWNSGSLARWQYSVPYVQRFHVFEMPLLGYAGYLPFGVECALIADLVARLVAGQRFQAARNRFSSLW